MAHEISINSTSGQAEAVFGFGEKPWWASKDFPAIVLPDAVSFDQIFSIAFPWQAEMEQLQYADGGLSSQHGIRRSDTKAELGVHSGSYGNIQPRDLFDFCAAFFQEHPEVPIATAIAMQGGAVLNISARLGEINILGSGDIHKSYLCFVNSFNGRIKAQVYKSYVQPVCMNTTVAGVKAATFTMEYKHTKNVRQRIAEHSTQAAALMAAQQVTDANVQEVLEKLAQKKPTRQAYETILNDLFGSNDSSRTKNVKAQVTDLVANGVNAVAFPDFRGTGYGIYCALTDYADHYRPIRLTNTRAGMSATQVRAETGILGEGADLKRAALHVLEKVLVLSDGSEEVEHPTYSLPPVEVTPTYSPPDFDGLHAEIEGFLKDTK